MTDISGPAFLEARGPERPDLTAFDFPDASLVDAASEEIEIDQALSLAGRFGRDFLGMQIMGLRTAMATEHLSITTADHEQFFTAELSTRTGSFNYDDPELIHRHQVGAAVTAPTTATSQGILTDMEILKRGEPYLYVAPRLFFRAGNNLDATLAIGDLFVMWASVSVKLTFRAFIELIERFADVTLL